MPVAGLEAVPRYAELVYRLLGEDVDFIPPGFELELDRPEWAFLKREFLLTGNASVAAGGAGTNAIVGITNLLNAAGPQQANLFVLTRIHVLGNNAAARTIIVTIDRNVSSLTGALFSSTLASDWRVRRNQNGTGAVPFLPIQIVAGTFAGVTGNISMHRQQPIGIDVDIPCSFILPPNTQVLVNNNTQNDQILVNFEGFYRQARREELGE